jgi:hypothetical protein
VEAGYNREYGHNPYTGYKNTETTMFPLSHQDDRYQARWWILGVEVIAKYIVFLFSELKKKTSPVPAKFNGSS